MDLRNVDGNSEFQKFTHMPTVIKDEYISSSWNWTTIQKRSLREVTEVILGSSMERHAKHASRFPQVLSILWTLSWLHIFTPRKYGNPEKRPQREEYSLNCGWRPFYTAVKVAHDVPKAQNTCVRYGHQEEKNPSHRWSIRLSSVDDTLFYWIYVLGPPYLLSENAS